MIDLDACRRQFPALKRTYRGERAVFLDGPAGSQVPQSVIDAVSQYLATQNANSGGVFETSIESDEVLAEAASAVAAFLGTGDSDLVAFGPNMTTLTLAFSRAMSRRWSPGDEIVVTRLDHDANFSPWVLAAADAGATVRYADIREADCTLDLEQLERLLCERTRLLAIPAASNCVGSVQSVRDIVERAHGVGAEVFVDAVHLAPHRRIDVEEWGCDYLVCSAYKFFGPHVGILWGRRDAFETLPAYKVRPAPDGVPGRWMTGTQSHEGIAGTLAAVCYLASLGDPVASAAAGAGSMGAPDRGSNGLGAQLDAAFDAIERHESELSVAFLRGAAAIDGLRVWGITDPERLAERVPTFVFTHERVKPDRIAAFLAERGIFCWSGNFYAQPLTERLGLEPEGLVRVGFLHYNGLDDVERLLEALREL